MYESDLRLGLNLELENRDFKHRTGMTQTAKIGYQILERISYALGQGNTDVSFTTLQSTLLISKFYVKSTLVQSKIQKPQTAQGQALYTSS